MNQLEIPFHSRGSEFQDALYNCIQKLYSPINLPTKRIKIERLSDPKHAAIVAKWLWGEWEWTYRVENGIQSEALLSENLIKKQVWVGFYREELVGTFGIEENDMEDRPQWSPWLTSLYVPPHHRNKGYGRELLKHASNQSPMYLWCLITMLPWYGEEWEVVEKRYYHGRKVAVCRRT